MPPRWLEGSDGACVCTGSRRGCAAPSAAIVFSKKGPPGREGARRHGRHAEGLPDGFPAPLPRWPLASNTDPRRRGRGSPPHRRSRQSPRPHTHGRAAPLRAGACARPIPLATAPSPRGSSSGRRRVTRGRGGRGRAGVREPAAARGGRGGGQGAGRRGRAGLLWAVGAAAEEQDGAVCSGGARLRRRVHHQAAHPKGEGPAGGGPAAEHPFSPAPCHRAPAVPLAGPPGPRLIPPLPPRVLQGRIEYLVKWKGWAIK